MNERITVHGPYDTDSDAMRDAAHVHQAYRVNYERGLMDRIDEGMLLGALREAGVELGAYDRRIAGWLAGGEPHVVQVILGWIERAHAAGHSAGNLGANWAHHVAASRTQADAEAAEAVSVEDSLPWHVYGLPRPGDQGRPWLVNAFATRELAERFAGRHPEYGPLTVVDAGEPERVCGKCGQPFDPSDTRFDGRAEERSMPGYCRGCVDRCHDSEDAFHVCVICRPAEHGQRGGGA